MVVSNNNPPKRPLGVSIDTFDSCVRATKVPLTAEAQIEELDRQFQEHCAKRLQQLEHGASVYCDEEGSVTMK